MQAKTVAAILWTTCALGGTARAAQADFEAIGRAYLAERGLDPAEATTDDLFRAGFARLALGAFELAVPAEALADRARAERFQDAARAVVAIQETWLATVDPHGERVDRAAVAEDAEEVADWIDDWSGRDLADVEPGAELGATLPAKDAERAALERFDAALRAAGLPVAGGEPPARARMILMPDRAGFVSLTAALGVLVPDQRGNYWVRSMSDWVEVRWEDVRVVALEFADADPGTWAEGVPMDARSDTGLEQQVAQLAIASLVLTRFENRIAPDFSLALCNNLVVDRFGRVETRTDGDLRPREAPPRAAFVPGGLSHGGMLPPGNADSRWRAHHGAERFRELLADAQKDGAREAGERKALDRFLLVSADGSEERVVRAPFFGPAAAETAVPGGVFQGDWSEFQRAYRAAFCHFLRVAGAGDEDASRAAFAALLTRVASATDDGFAAAVEAAYGAPVSAARPGEGDLEGRFLRWIRAAR